MHHSPKKVLRSLLILVGTTAILFTIFPKEVASASDSVSYLPKENTLEGIPLYCTYIDEWCAFYPDVPAALIKAMVEHESNWNPKALSKTNDHGLMQINPRWFGADMERLGITDLFDPFQNLHLGIDYMARLLRSHAYSVKYCLMSYNGGEDYAKRMSKGGKVSDYASSIYQRYLEIEKEGL